MAVTRSQVLAYRCSAHGFASDPPRGESALLDLGVQDTGPDGAGWALRIRDGEPAEPAHLAMLWTIRGAPHVYRRRELAAVASATSPYSEADAAKRIFDAAKPLREAGISAPQALDFVAERMREIVTDPMVKGQLSGALTSVLPDPYLRFCRPCGTIHIYEMTFRLGATRAGLELEQGTSPPVLRPSFAGPAGEAPDHLDPMRAYLHFFGPATPRQVAAYLDAPVRDVKEHWPADSTEVQVETGAGEETRWILASGEGEEALLGAEPSPAVRLLAPFDPYLQVRDRELLVPEPEQRKELWPTLGRPGAVLSGGELVAVWRPRKSGEKLTVRLRPWRRLSTGVKTAIDEEVERLAGFRGATSVSVTEED